jgi:hypothetical protein
LPANYPLRSVALGASKMGAGSFRVAIATCALCAVYSTATAQDSVDDHYRTFPKQRLTEIQKMLVWTDDYTGSADGVFGPATIAAIEKYQLQNNWNADGFLRTIKSER